jgi:hypothetical protein
MKCIAFIVAISATLLTGCASLGIGASTNLYDANIDSQKVSLIDRVARARGVEVHWVNYPQRKSTAVVPALGEPTGT